MTFAQAVLTAASLGLSVNVLSDGRVRVVGDARHGEAARDLLAHKQQVIRTLADGKFGLDWFSGQHFGRRPEPCRHCQRPAGLRDDDGRPAHKVCAEAAVLVALQDMSTSRTPALAAS